ncbi:10028_t:CDS:2 [Gigaspora rosea]|nr:10028_t:CDS:2 [Gigaspora rosea]
MTREQFTKPPSWEQRNILNELVQGAAHSKSKAIRQQNYKKHMELVRKHISDQRPKLKKPERLDLSDKMYRETYTIDHLFRENEKDDDEESVKSNNTTNSQNSNWKNKLIKGLTSPISGLKKEQQVPHSPSKPSSLRNSIDIAQNELQKILKQLPTQLEPGQTLSIPPQRPRIQRKFLPQRLYSPLANETL